MDAVKSFDEEEAASSRRGHDHHHDDGYASLQTPLNQPPSQRPPESPPTEQHGMLRLAFCATGICVCYLYYGVLQEKLFSGHNNRVLGPTFVLVTQCITNTAVAYLWQHISESAAFSTKSPNASPSDDTHQHSKSQPRQEMNYNRTNARVSAKDEEGDHSFLVSSSFSISSSNGNTVVNGSSAHSYSFSRNSTTKATSPSSNNANAVLPHALLVLTSTCYVSAMTCSNEAIPYVSYPVAVLAKSCKLIPTMLMGQLVEGRLYSTSEWMAALFISSGIVLFHFSRMKMQTGGIMQDHQSTYGMTLLLISLAMDGLLSSCQNFLKAPNDHVWLLSRGGTSTRSTPNRPSRRAPNAVETMLYINLYALLWLIPLAVYTGQFQQGMLLVLGWSSNRTADSSTGTPWWWWLWSLLLLNMAVAAGQIFIFLTITWYSPVVTTTITTTRKFFTILLSVWTFGHSFTVLQWTAVAMVFCGLYTAILPHQPIGKSLSSSASVSRSSSQAPPPASDPSSWMERSGFFGSFLLRSRRHQHEE